MGAAGRGRGGEGRGCWGWWRRNGAGEQGRSQHAVMPLQLARAACSHAQRRPMQCDCCVWSMHSLGHWRVPSAAGCSRMRPPHTRVAQFAWAAHQLRLTLHQDEVSGPPSHTAGAKHRRKTRCQFGASLTEPLWGIRCCFLDHHRTLVHLQCATALNSPHTLLCSEFTQPTKHGRQGVMTSDCRP
jgi:hypothetical protein